MTECFSDVCLLYELSGKVKFVLLTYLSKFIGLEIWIDLQSDFYIVWFYLFCLHNYTTLLLSQRKLLYRCKCKFLFKS